MPCNVSNVGEAYSSHSCSCHSAGLSCTPYCYCVGEAMCFNPFTKHENEARHDNEDEGDSTEEEGELERMGEEPFI